MNHEVYWTDSFGVIRSMPQTEYVAFIRAAGELPDNLSFIQSPWGSRVAGQGEPTENPGHAVSGTPGKATGETGAKPGAEKKPETADTPTILNISRGFTKASITTTADRRSDILSLV